jgi:parallel beta-helix repeat protein
MDDGIEGNGQFFIYSNNISNNGHGLPSDITNGDGIEIMASAKASEIINNIISYNGVDGIWDETVDDHLITDNIIHHNGQSGIHLEEGRDCKIRNNIIYGNGYGEFGKSGAGIILYQSTSNIIDNNDVYDNNRGIYLQQSHYNEISDNEIYGNEKAGIDLHQTSGTQIFNNNIKENFVGLLLMFANNFQILYNDIYLNSLFGLVSVLSVGAATLNWWGHMFGPYMVQILRIPPLITMVTPWSINRNNA